MTSFDPSAARISYGDKETEELIRFAYFEPGFTSAAIDIAKEELVNRGISDSEHDLVKSVASEIVQEEINRESLENEPLHIGWKI